MLEATLSWLENQTYNNIRLLIMNGTHQDLSPSDLGLGHWRRSLTIERFDAGMPGLADEDRTTGDAIRAKVESAVAGIYNRAVQLAAPDEYLFFLEDDVIPRSLSAISELMELMQPRTFAVSGLYKHRYQDRACAFRTPISVDNMLPIEGPDFEQVHGTGFGVCWLGGLSCRHISLLEMMRLIRTTTVNSRLDCCRLAGGGFWLAVCLVIIWWESTDVRLQRRRRMPSLVSEVAADLPGPVRDGHVSRDGEPDH